MKTLNPIFHLALILCCTTTAAGLSAQKASDVLEDGIPVQRNENIYLKFDGTAIRYNLDGNRGIFYPLSDSTIFMIRNQGGANLRLAPVNPLNFAYEQKTVLIDDPINASTAAVLQQINTFPGLIETSATRPTSAAKPRDCLAEMNLLVKQIKDSLADDRRSQIAGVFRELKTLNFSGEEQTRSELVAISIKVAAIEKHFAGVNEAISKLDQKIRSYNCVSGTDTTIVKFVYSNIARELVAVKNEQQKRTTLLRKSYTLVEEAYKKARDNDWWYALGTESPGGNKMALFTLVIFESGYQLSPENEIVPLAQKEKAKRTLRIRQFQWFVPEVSAGMAYSWITFPKFATQADSTGALFVASAGNDVIRRINFTAMLNFNFYIPQSPVHPFWQVGVGANSGFPTLLTGVGIRTHIGQTRFAVSTGFASSWIRTLDKLAIGDRVSGEAELEKDMKYEFNWAPKAYIGFQFNF